MYFDALKISNYVKYEIYKGAWWDLPDSIKLLREKMTVGLVEQVVSYYWTLIPTYGVVEPKKPFKNTFSTSSYKIFRLIEAGTHTEFLVIINIFVAIVNLIAKGEIDLKILNPKQADIIKKKKDQIDPDIMDGIGKDITNQLLLTGSILAIGAMVIYGKSLGAGTSAVKKLLK